MDGHVEPVQLNSYAQYLAQTTCVWDPAAKTWKRSPYSVGTQAQYVATQARPREWNPALKAYNPRGAGIFECWDRMGCGAEGLLIGCDGDAAKMDHISVTVCPPLSKRAEPFAGAWEGGGVAPGSGPGGGAGGGRGAKAPSPSSPCSFSSSSSPPWRRGGAPGPPRGGPETGAARGRGGLDPGARPWGAEEEVGGEDAPPLDPPEAPPGNQAGGARGPPPRRGRPRPPGPEGGGGRRRLAPPPGALVPFRAPLGRLAGPPHERPPGHEEDEEENDRDDYRQRRAHPVGVASGRARGYFLAE